MWCWTIWPTASRSPNTLTEGSISAIVTRNKADYSASELSILSPDEFLVQFDSQDK